LAWLKLQFLCHKGDTEVGGFGITAPDDPMYVQDFITVPQEVTSVSVAFRDDGIADFFENSVDAGLAPDRFARIWMHTHPGASVTPSITDEETFSRVFGACDWSLMFILGRTARTYARLSFSAGPRAALRLRCSVDWRSWPAQLSATDLQALTVAWQDEYSKNVHVAPSSLELVAGSVLDRSPLESRHVQELDAAFLDPWNGGVWHEWDHVGP
jgi:hypothetical protein